MSDEFIRFAPVACLECGHTLDALGAVDGSAPTPEPGDAVACIRCGAVMTYEAGSLRGFTDAEMDALTADTAYMYELAMQVHRIHLIKHMGN